MKKALLSIAAMALLSSQGYAQPISLTESSFNNPLNTVDSFIFITSGFNNISDSNTNVNNIKLGGLWDLDQFAFVPSNSTVNPRYKTISHVTAPTGYDYADRMVDTFNRKSPTSTTNNSPKLIYMSDGLVNMTTGGIMESGKEIPRTAYSLSFLPGALPTDSLVITEQTSMYYSTTVGNQLVDRNKLKFPLTSPNAAWINNYQDTTFGTVTYTLGGYVNAPFFKKSDYIETKVLNNQAGWGKMTVRMPNNQISDTFRVIQVRTTFQVTDNYYLNGTPAPQAVLDSLGVNNGTAILYYYDEYYREDEVSPLLTVRFTDATFNNVQSNRSFLHMKNLKPSSVANVAKENGLKIYPNPVKGGTINVDVKGANGDWTYSVININGQSVKGGTLSLSKGNAQITLPTNIPAGTYYITLDDGQQVMIQSLSIVE